MHEGLVNGRGLGWESVKRSVGPVERPGAAAHAARDVAGAGKRQGEAKARVEECDKPVGEYARGAHSDAEGHHERHHEVALAVEESDDVVALPLQVGDALSVLLDELAEHGVERAEDGDGAARERKENNRRGPPHVDGRAHAKNRNIQAGEQPDDAGDDDQGLLLDAESTQFLASFSSAVSAYRAASRRVNSVSHSPPSMSEAKILRST